MRLDGMRIARESYRLLSQEGSTKRDRKESNSLFLWWFHHNKERTEQLICVMQGSWAHAGALHLLSSQNDLLLANVNRQNSFWHRIWLSSSTPAAFSSRKTAGLSSSVLRESRCRWTSSATLPAYWLESIQRSACDVLVHTHAANLPSRLLSADNVSVLVSMKPLEVSAPLGYSGCVMSMESWIECGSRRELHCTMVRKGYEWSFCWRRPSYGSEYERDSTSYPSVGNASKWFGYVLGFDLDCSTVVCWKES